ncbi:MAG: DnaB-like helicase C-terminal domain-containing protein [Thermoanaerobaculia bacterium]
MQTVETAIRTIGDAVSRQGRPFRQQRSGAWTMVTCPAHEDQKPSLAVGESSSRGVALKCHSGCSFKAVADAAGLDLRDEAASHSGEAPCTGDTFYTYCDRSGAPVLRKIRKPGKRFVWEHADGRDGWTTGTDGRKAGLYHAEKLDRNPEALVWVAEGEKDAGRLTREGLLAVCNPHGAGEPDLSPYLDALRGRDVAILYDDDRKAAATSAKNPGLLHGEKWLAALEGVARSARLVHLPVPDAAEKFDVSDYLDAGGSIANLQELYRTAAGTARDERERRLIVRSQDLDAWAILESEEDPGVSTGIRALDPVYRVGRGLLDIWTGIPSHGKSGMLDQISVNLARLHGWRFAIYSAENLPYAGYKARLLEKWSRRRLRRSRFDEAPRITRTQYETLTSNFDSHFSFIAAEDGQTVDSILEAASLLDDERKIDGLIIDPWNELDHSRPEKFSETEYISAALGRLRRFARARSIHVWIIAHPTKLTASPDGSYAVPSMYSISGSAHWANKADVGVVVWRDKAILSDGFPSTCTKFYVRKMRRSQFGQDGEAELAFVRTYEGYEDPVEPRVYPHEVKP